MQTWVDFGRASVGPFVARGQRAKGQGKAGVDQKIHQISCISASSKQRKLWEALRNSIS
jgi:hypothetical protein